MPSVRILKEFKEGTYFFTLTVKNWYYIFDRYYRWHILANSLKFFQENKSLKIYGFVFMINHIHLIAHSPDAIAFIRDFKKFTTKEILKNIKNTEPRVLKLFETGRNTYAFWEKTNMPEIVETENFFFQKLKYIHGNPIKREYVMVDKDWYWSSANSDCELKIDDVYDKIEEEIKN